MTTARFAIEHATGSAAAFHDRELPDPARRSVWWFEVDRPTVVLGSTQGLELVDQAAARRAGVEVVRRRSGGGAVWLAPGAVTWVDVVIPAGDPRWHDDVGRSGLWLGEAWVRALEQVGVAGAVVHRGPLVAGPRARLVCFAGLAPGEVTVGGAKVVGISQRRTRAAARFQCAVLHRWDLAPMLDVLDLEAGERVAVAAELAPVAVGVGEVSSAALVAALLAELRRPD